jgi:2-isopropylmalate synthase
VNAVTQGIEAQGEVTVRLERDGRIVNGMSADTDVIAASAKAYINALNLLWNEVDKAHPQPHHL